MLAYKCKRGANDSIVYSFENRLFTMRSFVFANKHCGGTPMAFHKGVQGIPSTAQRRQIGITMGAIGEGLK